MSEPSSVKNWPVLRLIWETDETGQKVPRFVEDRMDISALVVPLSEVPELTGLDSHGEDGGTRR